MDYSEHRKKLKDARKVMVKIGTDVISNGTINEKRLDDLVSDIAKLHNSGKEVYVTTSGAIATGKSRGKLSGEEDVAHHQAYFSLGMGHLFSKYAARFEKYEIEAGLTLLTYDSLMDVHKRKNVNNVFDVLVGNRKIPIINENDTVATDELESNMINIYDNEGRVIERREIRFGDNDRLSSMVAKMRDVDAYVLLTSIEGLMDFSKDEAVRYVPVENLGKYEQLVTEKKSNGGTGGMVSKLNYGAEFCREKGAYAIIADGRKKGVLESIFSGNEEGTLLIPQYLNNFYGN